MQSAKPAEVHGSINRNIVECKENEAQYICKRTHVLIETSWNVKMRHNNGLSPSIAY